MNDLSIIIVTWNSRACLVDCLRSIEAAGSEYSILVVDNHSSDGTVEELQQEFPDVSVIANRSNLGFAAANNQGLRAAESRYTMLLNPDTIVHPGALGAMVRFMDEHPAVWAAGPAMFNRDGSRQQTGVRFPDNWNILCEALFLDRVFPQSRVFGRHKELFEEMSGPRAVDYVQGACLIVRREVFEKLGGLDETFFMYFEETDWCYRMKKQGGEVYLVPGAEVTHLGGGDIGHYDKRRLVYYHQSLLLFYRKHYSWPSSLMVRGIILLRSFIRIIVWTAVAIRKPGVRSSALSSIRGYLHIPGILIHRG